MDLWEHGDKIWSCCNSKEHVEGCDRTGEVIEATNFQVDLHNEAEEWTKRSMLITGVPEAFARAGIPMDGIGVEIFETEMRLTALIKYLNELIPDFDVKRANEVYHEVMLEKLKYIRGEFDKAKRQEGMLVAKTQLLGPDGKTILH